MNTGVQATAQPGARPIAGILVPLVLAGIATIAAVALSLSVLWVASVIGVAILLVLIFRFPRLYVYFFFAIALVPYSFLDYLDQFRLFSDSNVSINLVGVGWVLNVVLFAIYTVRKRVNWWNIPFYRPFFVLAAVALPTMLLTPDWTVGVRNWIHLVSPLCLSLLLFVTITNREQARETVMHIFFIFAVVIGIGWYQLLTGSGSYDTISESYRLSGIYGEHGEVNFAAILLYLTCLAAPLALQHGSKMRIPAVFMAGSAVVLLVSSQSRTPLLGLLAAGPVMLLKSRVKRGYWFLLLLILLAAQMSSSVYARFGGPLLSAPTQFERNSDVYVNLIQRGETWAMLSGQFLDVRTILVGRGFGRVDHFLQQELDDPRAVYTHAVHNEYLRLLVDMGLIGVSLMLGQLILIYRTGSRLCAEAADGFSRGLAVSLPALAVSYAALAVTSNMYGVEPHTVIFWVPVGLALACSKWTAANRGESHHAPEAS